MTLNAPHSQGVKLHRAEILGLLPLLLRLALEEQGCGTPGRGLRCCGTPASHPAAVTRRAVAVQAVHNWLLSWKMPCSHRGMPLSDSALIKEKAGWEQKAFRLCHSCHPWGQLWPIRRECGQTGPCTFQPLFLEHVSWLSLTELQSARETLLLQGSCSPHWSNFCPFPQGKR